MSHMGFKEPELCTFMDPFLSLAEFTKLYSLAMTNRGEEVVAGTPQDNHGNSRTSFSVNGCLPDLFDNFLL